jgi:CDGSH-type Zn-finger protein
MSEEKATITVRPNGSLRVTGATLIGADGQVITNKETYSLCRCGHSSDKPFCDGAHRSCEFIDEGIHSPVE